MLFGHSSHDGGSGEGEEDRLADRRRSVLSEPTEGEPPTVAAVLFRKEGMAQFSATHSLGGGGSISESAAQAFLLLSLCTLHWVAATTTYLPLFKFPLLWRREWRGYNFHSTFHFSSADRNNFFFARRWKKDISYLFGRSAVAFREKLT